jgi:hypothetical protein
LGKVIDMNPLNPYPPSTEIMALPFLAVVTITLFQYVVYTGVKKHGYRTTCREILRLEMILLKITIVYMSRLILLIVVTTLPLIGIGLSTELFALSLLYFLHITVLSPLSLDSGIVFSLLFLLIVGKFMPWFMDNYGAIYKLPLMVFPREDIRQFFKKHLDILMVLLVGFVLYTETVIELLILLVNIPSFLLKIVVGIIIGYLLVVVLDNKKYDNAINLVEKIWKIQRKR